MAISKEAVEAIRGSGLFDSDWYLREYGDVAALGMDPLEHYAWIGETLLRDPCPDFDTSYYAQTNPDVLAAGMSLFHHYIISGRAEGRPGRETRRRDAGPFRHDGIHFWLDCSRPGPGTWAGVELVMALHAQGRTVTLPPCPEIHPSIRPEYADTLRSLFCASPNAAYHLKWTQAGPEQNSTPLFGDVNAELFCTNFRAIAPGRPQDLWTRHVRDNGYHKLPVSGFTDAVLDALGVPTAERRIVPLGYAPEADRLDPDQARLPRPEFGDLNLLLPIDSRDLYRYGTDLAIEALARAYTEADPVVVHIKDHGAPVSDTVKTWIARHPRFPRVCWHNEFLPKDELIRLYAAMDVLLLPFRGEGFAMQPLDAMAVGVPCVMPLYGGPTEYCDATLCLPLAFTEAPIGICADSETTYLGQGTVWCEPDPDALTAVLTRLPGDRDGLRQIGERARAHVRAHFSWRHSADRLMTALAGWRAGRYATVARRLRPDRYCLSVIVATRDNPEALRRSLDAYAVQDLSRAQYQILVVNDHGDRAALERVAGDYVGMDLEILDNPGPAGLGAAQNVGIERARGEIVLLSDEGVAPGPDFLRQHCDAHAARGAENTAFVSAASWQPGLERTPFLNFLLNQGGGLWDDGALEDGAVLSCERLHAANLSVRRSVVIEQQRLLDPAFEGAEGAAVELAYRLHLHGLTLRYLKRAVALYGPPADPQTLLARHRRRGRLLTALAVRHPSLLPGNQTSFLRQLEVLRASRSLQDHLERFPGDAGELANATANAFVVLLETATTGSMADKTNIARSDLEQWKEWTRRRVGTLWDTARELDLRKGMVEAWADGDERLADLGWRWVLDTQLARLFVGQTPEWDVPLANAW